MNPNTGKARPKIVSQTNVLEAALNRIRWIFDEFQGNVVVNNSGGKDSTVVLELALMVAREKGMLPLRVQWVDQECEFDATVRHQRTILARSHEIDFSWYQVPFRLFNATNHSNPWLNVWGEGEEWVRDKEPGTIHDHDFYRADGSKVDRFKEVLDNVNATRQGQAVLTGVRAEESPNRRIMMLANPGYKYATWSNRHIGPRPDQFHYRFHPIWDWRYIDVWKAIYDHGWAYNEMYDMQYRYGVPVSQMRVSNYHHVQALGALNYLQEAEPQTWEAATRRLEGINTHGHVGVERVKTLPYMFSSWAEYAQHLIDNLAYPEHRPAFEKMWVKIVKKLPHVTAEEVAYELAWAVIKNDYVGASLDAWVLLQQNKGFKAQKPGSKKPVVADTEDDEEAAILGVDA